MRDVAIGIVANLCGACVGYMVALVTGSLGGNSGLQVLLACNAAIMVAGVIRALSD